MAEPKATNTYVIIIRDEVESKMDNLFIPDQGKVKPHRGDIFSVGGKVTDPDIKNGKGKKAMFHQGIGFTVEYEGKDYLFLQEHEVIAIIK